MRIPLLAIALSTVVTAAWGYAPAGKFDAETDELGAPAVVRSVQRPAGPPSPCTHTPSLVGRQMKPPTKTVTLEPNPTVPADTERIRRIQFDDKGMEKAEGSMGMKSFECGQFATGHPATLRELVPASSLFNNGASFLIPPRSCTRLGCAGETATYGCNLMSHVAQKIRPKNVYTSLDGIMSRCSKLFYRKNDRGISGSFLSRKDYMWNENLKFFVGWGNCSVPYDGRYPRDFKLRPNERPQRKCKRCIGW